MPAQDLAVGIAADRQIRPFRYICSTPRVISEWADRHHHLGSSKASLLLQGQRRTTSPSSKVGTRPDRYDAAGLWKPVHPGCVRPGFQLRGATVRFAAQSRNGALLQRWLQQPQAQDQSQRPPCQAGQPMNLASWEWFRFDHRWPSNGRNYDRRPVRVSVTTRCRADYLPA
jgi:hypothetical protein